MAETAISLHGLSKRYWIKQATDPDASVRSRLGHLLSRRRGPQESFWALDGVSFEIERGDIVGIVGRNGAGKSTLLKLLARITEPTRGEAVLRGRVGSLLEVGTGFHPELTGRENIYLNGAVLGMSRRDVDAQFDAIVEFSGTAAFIDTPVKRYSSGMYVRLAFAVAAHLRCDILMIDEVLAVGDAEFQKRCLGAITDLASSGRTVLFVSHHAHTVAALCRRAALLTQGQLASFGDSASVLNEYAAMLRARDDAADDFRERRGTGQYRYLRAKFDREAYRVGEAPTLRFRLERRFADADTSLLFLGANIYNDRGIKVTYVDSRLNGVWIPSTAETIEGELTFGAIWMPPGSYTVNLSAYRAATGAVDYWDAACMLHVAPILPYDEPSFYEPATAGVMLTDFRWNIDIGGDRSGPADIGRDLT